MVTIRNDYLEQRITSEQKRRGKATMASTAEELLIERLTQIEGEGHIDRRDRKRKPTTPGEELAN